MTVLDKVGVALLTLMLIPLIAVIGPAAIGALAGAAGAIFMMRVLAPRR